MPHALERQRRWLLAVLLTGQFMANVDVAVIGIATFGTAYLSLASQPGPQAAMHAFALVTVDFAATTFLASRAAYRSIHQTLRPQP